MVTNICLMQEKAMALKEEGNRLFKEGDVKAARDLYTQSLSMYPLIAEDPASAKEYSVILANRDEERELCDQLMLEKF